MEDIKGLQMHPYLQRQMQKTENAILEADVEDAAAALRRSLEYITEQYLCRYKPELKGNSLYEIIKALEECGAESPQVIDLWEDIRIFGNRCGAHKSSGSGSLNKAEYLFKDMLLYLPVFLEKFPEPMGEQAAVNNAAGENGAGLAASGHCGDKGENLIWKLDNMGTLTISGKGKMADFTPGESENVIKRGILGVQKETPIPWYEHRDKIKSVVLQEGVKNIGTAAFWECTELVSVGLPWNLQKIGARAFAHCQKLRNIRLPDYLLGVGDAAFWNCSSLEEITIPRAVTSLDKWNFAGCQKLSRAVFSNTICYMGVQIFSWCDNLTIEAPAGSLALKYAELYKISYRVIA